MLFIALLNLLCGVGFALAARDRIRADGATATPSFTLVALHAGAVVAPAALYFYVVHPAWSWMYWVEPKRVSLAAGIPLMVGHAALVFAGWFASGFLLRRQFQRAVTYGAGTLVLATLVLLLLLRKRLLTAADFIGWAAGKGTSIFNVVLGWALLVTLLALFTSAGYVVVELLRDSRRVRAR